MKRLKKRLTAFLLVVSMVFTSTVSVYAADEENYISELRLIYADDFDEAEEIIEESEFADYEVLDYNLNNKTGEQGVWLAYKTTTDIEDAITDIAVMQMQGGYQEGNYQEMIQQSFEEYQAMGEIYLEAIDYFTEAYDAGDFLAECAYRQLNFYCDNDEHDGALLGDLFVDGMDALELATMFMQGNSYVLQNIRALLAQGVAYNESGENYLELVSAAAAEMNEDEAVFEDYEEEYDELALLIAGTVITYKDLFEELSTVEEELDYTDEEFTDLELQYAEYKSLADRFRAVTYLGGQSLYDFCLSYELDEEDLTALYPLASALNDGQIALTRVAHYYDVVRYSMTDLPEEMMEENIAELEEQYGENPFDIYTGVDRTIYTGSFALTSEAYRADAYTESGFWNQLFNEENALTSALTIGAGAVGTGIFVWAICKSVNDAAAASSAALAAQRAADAAYALKIQAIKAANAVGSYNDILIYGSVQRPTYSNILDSLLAKYFPGDTTVNQLMTSGTFYDKIQFFNAETAFRSINVDGHDSWLIGEFNGEIAKAQKPYLGRSAQQQAQDATQTVATNGASGFVTGALYLVGGALMLYSAINMGLTVYNYYHPEYDDIPVAMVDMIDTVDGDRYIKYDAVYEAEYADDGEYAVGDLNAFAGERWNALYYTKSYEAGKPLLADFVVSTDNNKAEENHLPVHRFGEEICYDLNKYNFDNDSENIYLSVKQSENQKSAVADVPEVVGSVFSFGYFFLAAGVGAALGVGGTIVTQSMLKKKKTNNA